MSSMINTETLEIAMKLAIWSIKIKDEIPVSLLILAPPEHGKTAIMLKLSQIDTVKTITDFNTFQFQDFVNDYIADKKRTIIIPDFLKVMRKKYSTQQNAIGIINAITEEGWIGKLPLGQSVDRRINANVITALVPQEIKDKRRKWSQLGFLSRFVPLSFSYSDVTKEMIRGYIKDRNYRSEVPIKAEIGVSQNFVYLPKTMAEMIENIALGTLLRFKDTDLTGFRLQRQLQVLAMSSALSKGREEVNEEDVNLIKEISHFINFDFNMI